MSETPSEKSSNKPDRWKMIANLLGLAPSEAPATESTLAESAAVAGAAESVPADVQPVVPPTPPTPVRKAEPKPKRDKAPRRASWAALCGELGIEVPPEPASEASEPDAAELVSEGTAELTADDVPGGQIDAEPDHSSHAAFRDAELSALETPDADSEICAGVDDMESVEEIDEVLAEEVAEVEEGDEGEEGEEAVSDDDDASDEPGETAALRRRRRRRRRRTSSASRDDVAERDTVPQPADADSAQGSDGDELDAEVIEEVVEADGDEDREGAEDESSRGSERRRRPRRRRRRSGRRDVAAVEKELDSEVSRDDLLDAEDVAEVDEDDDDDDVEVNLDLDDDDDDDLPARHGRGSGDEGRRGGDASSRGKHKKIPTWEEAISVIVSANMETRRRDGNSGRNRPRGGGSGGGSRRRGRGSHDRRG